MKIKRMFLVTIAILVILLTSCSSFCNTKSNDKKGEKMDLSILQGKTWQLIKVKKTGKNIELNRDQMNTIQQENMFTLIFKDKNISGKGFPNNYSGQITNQDNRKLSFPPIVSTRMALLTNTNNLLLQEDEYFQLLQKTTSWDIKDNNLILNTVDNENKEAKLIYNIK
ncbi:MAG: META domain-containing protein [Spirochaetaceae bacterium]|nr:META domain-containing protein [Spirochaetaceae bacterium]